MNTENSNLSDTGDTLRQSLKDLAERTGELADLNDEPHLHMGEVESIIAAFARVLFYILKARS